MSEVKILATGLKFPEGPVVMPDGSVVVTEIAGGQLSRVTADGKVSVYAKTGGGPNGAAIGPDGALYVCNNGGGEYKPGSFMAIGPAKDYAGGYIQRVDAKTGEVRTLYTHCGDKRLSSPNDIVFDTQGGFYFTDFGKKHHHARDNGGLYYAGIDGKRIVELSYPVASPNGIGLSPDGKTLYVADCESSRLWAWDVLSPGVLKKDPFPSPNGGRLVCGLPGYQRFDSLAVQANGDICVGTLIGGCITVISPSGSYTQVKVPDVYPTNICFGGADMKTAYITLSSSGQLGVMPWAEAGLRLNF